MTDIQSTGPDSGRETLSLVRLLCGIGVVLASIWLIVSPFELALDFVEDDAAAWNTIVVGVISLMAIVGAFARTISMAAAFAIAGISGIWAILAPYLVDFVGGTGSDAAVSSITTGIVLFALAGIGLATLDQQSKRPFDS
jgi:hypothetical protein